ncbi:serine-tRNA ligase [Schizosaccharomyces cryophilus OY26]|uniref:serine--tRNA ligase n=1 Tax=Schizosaccharomyces cryophilus (strain OY26 / ATCC MYA-4695 / CBS 11777 / NBRC 106824 / NRRL Y48691) TaxID=653667 RepID=S9VYX7_SCHCR|nr:serine-tRNA ligase [Schizosaccharomyces cryophilus OY26]EPY51419.1 serine-tRNA ligase [Schizosaccharomyces cryophilus OY26]
MKTVQSILRQPIFFSQKLWLRSYSTKYQEAPSSWKAMLNLKHIYEHSGEIHQNCVNRNMRAVAETLPTIKSLYEEHTAVRNQLTPYVSEKNKITGLIKSSKDGEHRSFLVSEAKNIKVKIDSIEKLSSDIQKKLYHYCLSLPNSTLPSVPLGSEDNAVCVASIGEQKNLNEKNFYIKDHLELAGDAIDLLSASETSGHAFCYIKGEVAELEMSLINYAIDFAKSRGWSLVIPPSIVRSDVALACGFQPRDEQGEQIYQLENQYESNSPKQCLVGTAEISLASLGFRQTFHDLKEKRVVGVSRSYRREAGARGRDTKGLYRLHEFTKVELFSWTHPSQSSRVFDDIIKLQIDFIHSLGLSARVLNMPTQELGAPAAQKYDIEAWMPSRAKFGEISSTSNCLDYQARRLLTRYKNSKDSGFVHTLNGTAAAIPRLVIALLESHQQPDGSVVLPQCLIPYLKKEKLFVPNEKEVSE